MVTGPLGGVKRGGLRTGWVRTGGVARSTRMTSVDTACIRSKHPVENWERALPVPIRQFQFASSNSAPREMSTVLPAPARQDAPTRRVWGRIPGWSYVVLHSR